MRALRIAISLVAATLTATYLYSETPTHGTINILLANGNGMVLVTDSRASDQFGRKANDQTRKLFQIDSVTVCSIAGFGTDPGPHDTIRENVGGDISSIIEGLAASPIKPSFSDKVSAFTAALALRLTSVEASYEYAMKSGPPRSKPQPLIMLFAGFDKDGSATIAKATISISSVARAFDSHQIFGSNIDIKVTEVTDFAYLTSGVDDSARYRLQSPMAFQHESELREYGQAMHDGRTAVLRLDQLERLATYLQNNASKTSGVIGGPPQIAILSGKQVQLITPETLLPERKVYTAGFVAYNIFADSSVPQLIFPQHTVFVADYCNNAVFILDDSAIIGGKYTNCEFYFDGADFYRDPNVEIIGGKLVLGPHVPMSGYFFDRAHKAMPELTPISYKDLPNGEVVAKRIWPTN